MSTQQQLKKLIRNVPDFPRKGIIFRDITTLLKNGKVFKEVINRIAAHYRKKKIDLVAGAESRGFIIGAALACKLGAGFIPIRKKKKLPSETIHAVYELEYGRDTLEMHKDAIKRGQKILIIDDLLATGGTAGATIDLVKQLGGHIVELAFLIELTPLKGREKLKDYPIFSLIKY